MAQFVTRLEDGLADRVDTLVAAGVLASRSEAVRIGIEKLVDELERAVWPADGRGIPADAANGGRAGRADEDFEQMLSEDPS